ncbi:At5g01610-like protein [Dioscorea alata]|uniref:At5g01610-like protein n=1 Tax=Dioscorea alata TaxID=55571 RepID=A0ACB7UK02_DIOAL|nr:At5g01610-like protein [Dioscorea alata]
MASQTIQSYRNGAEICNGDAFCKKKSIQLLEEIGLPNGLFPLDDIEEFGYNLEAGFVWLIQKKKKDHTFKKIKRAVSYGPEVTAFVEKGKMKKMTGVKTKELMLWLSVVEMYIEDPSSKKITFKTGTGLSDSFPVSAFELEE